MDYKYTILIITTIRCKSLSHKFVFRLVIYICKCIKKLFYIIIKSKLFKYVGIIKCFNEYYYI